MFDFQNLAVYQQAKTLNKEVFKFIQTHKQIDPYMRDQLRRAGISLVLNIAEGSGKFTKADKRNFYFIARGSAYECVAVFEMIKDEYNLDQDIFDKFYTKFESVSKMLLGLINVKIK